MSDDLEHSQRLFNWLAEDEPPQHFDPTEAGRTARKSVRMPPVSISVPVYQPKSFFRRRAVQQILKWGLIFIIGILWFSFILWFILRLAGLVPRILPEEPTPQPVILLAPPITAPHDTVQTWLEHPQSSPIPPVPAIQQLDSYETLGEPLPILQVMDVSPKGKTIEALASEFGISNCTLITANDPRLIIQWDEDLRILPEDGFEFEVKKPLTLAQLAEQTYADPDAIRLHDLNPNLWRANLDTVLEVGAVIFVPTTYFKNCTPWVRPPWLVNDDSAWQALLGCEYTNPYRGYPTNAPLPDQGYRLVKNFEPNGHYGVDLIAPENSPVYSAGDGVVRWAGWHADGYGYVVVIDHGGSHSLYAHLKEIIVSCGQPVAAEQLIASVGSSGNADGNHLHFELRNGGFMPVDPTYIISLGFSQPN